MTESNAVVEKTEQALALSTLAQAPFAPPRPGEGPFAIRCYERPSIGGTDTAPSPLAYRMAHQAVISPTPSAFSVQLNGRTLSGL